MRIHQMRKQDRKTHRSCACERVRELPVEPPAMIYPVGCDGTPQLTSAEQQETIGNQVRNHAIEIRRAERQKPSSQSKCARTCTGAAIRLRARIPRDASRKTSIAGAAPRTATRRGWARQLRIEHKTTHNDMDILHNQPAHEI